MSKTLTALELAYVALLRTPVTVLRIESQGALCALRDAIAFETNRDEEEVQNDYESRAHELNQTAKPVAWKDGGGAADPFGPQSDNRVRS